MEKFKQAYVWANSFVRNNLFLFIVVIFGGWFLLQSGSIGVTQRSLDYGYDSRNESVAMDIGSAMTTPRSVNMKMANFASNGIIEPPMAYADFDPTATERKIIKNANLEIEVEDTEKAKMDAEAETKNKGGSVTNMNSWEVRPGMLAYNLTVRIPAEKFENTIEALTFLGTKKSESFSTNDITAQYQDTSNRLKNLEARRERLREMMDRQTDKLADVLQIDQELSRVQIDIENLQSTLRRNDTDVAYSTLQLTLRPEPQIGDIENPYWSFSKSWKTSFNNLIQDSQGLADKLITLLVYIPIWVPIFLILWWIKRKITSQRANKTTSKK